MSLEPYVYEGEIVDDLCELCGVNEGELVVDPYSAEVYDEDIEMMLCDDCHQARADGI